jgi:hypothetical protein
VIGRASRLLTVSVAALLTLTGAASAGCVAGAWTGRLNENSNVRTTLLVTDGFCSFTFRGGLNVTYDALTIVRRPQHMSITPGSNGFSFTLRVRNRYTGPDAIPRAAAASRSPST